jgi:hypothetical protein
LCLIKIIQIIIELSTISSNKIKLLSHTSTLKGRYNIKENQNGKWKK